MYIEKPEMAKILRPCANSLFAIDVFEIKQTTWREQIPPGVYVRLLNKHECVMSDTPMEYRTNYNFIHSANGDVLIGGLGIGMVLMALKNNPNVKTITVVEKYKEVIDLVLPQLPLGKNVRVINADIWDWVPPRGVKFDTIYFDIWNYINSDVYEEMKQLKAKYRGRLVQKSQNPNRFMSCWVEKEAKYDRRLY